MYEPAYNSFIKTYLHGGIDVM